MKSATKVIVGLLFLLVFCVLGGILWCHTIGKTALGSKKNPQELQELGTVKVQLEAGDRDGYYYVWKASKDDVLKFEMTDAPIEVAYDIVLKNSSKRVSLTEDGVISGGIKTVSIEVKAGDEVLIQLVTKPEQKTGKYPKAELTAFGELGVGGRE